MCWDFVSPNCMEVAKHGIPEPPQRNNKRSMDLGALVDNYSWYDKCQFSANLYKKNAEN